MELECGWLMKDIVQKIIKIHNFSHVSFMTFHKPKITTRDHEVLMCHNQEPNVRLRSNDH